MPFKTWKFVWSPITRGMKRALVTDELWSIVEPVLPAEPPKPKGGRLRVSETGPRSRAYCSCCCF